MKARALIKEIREMIKLHGNREIIFMGSNGLNEAVMLVNAYDDHGNGEGDPEFDGIQKFVVHCSKWGLLEDACRHSVDK